MSECVCVRPCFVFTPSVVFSRDFAPFRLDFERFSTVESISMLFLPHRNINSLKIKKLANVKWWNMFTFRSNGGVIEKRLIFTCVLSQNVVENSENVQ